MAIDEILEEHDAGKVQLRDKWQFELKSDLYPLSQNRNNAIQQEFYIFIPNSLQINDATYTKAQFYRDQTNLIRLKTPTFTLQELLHPEQHESPLSRLRWLLSRPQPKDHLPLILEEIKLLGNVFHSALRNQVFVFMKTLSKTINPEVIPSFTSSLLELCYEITAFGRELHALKQSYREVILNEELHITFDYVHEFISLNIHDYFSALLYRLRLFHIPEFEPIDHQVQQILLREQRYRQALFGENPPSSSDAQHNEYILYRKGLLNKFVIDPLLLKISREATQQRYRTIIGAIPAGVAMLIYMSVLFFWQGSSSQGNFLLVNSQAFILLTVVVYMLKDRIKEELKFLSYQKASKWFSDFQTDIFSQEEAILGNLKESFYFIEEEKLPAEIMDIRNRQFHKILEEIKRPEKVIYYKKNVNIKKKPKTLESRFYGLNIIFRLDIHHFLAKCENPYHTYLDLHPESSKLTKIQLPRVYHINIIIKNTKSLPEGRIDVEWNKFRLIVDKNGIKRIEQV